MKKNISCKACFWGSLIGTLICLIGFGGITVYVDPLFHFHAPVEGIEYPLYDDKYMNDGIVRHFDYDAIIIGSSMAANFRTSVCDGVFGTHAVKIPLYGASYREINELLEQAFDHNDKITRVVRGLDSTMLITDKDIVYNEGRPEYLYDDNLLNDVEYVWNKDIYFQFTEYVFTFMRQGGKSTNFDTYKSYAGDYAYDAQRLKESYAVSREERAAEEHLLSKEDIQMLTQNLEQNVLALVREHPETEFYLFFPPYSILCFDQWRQRGELDRMLDAHEKAIQILLPYDNIHLYTFFDRFEMICDLGNYTDTLHYNREVCDRMLQCMAVGDGLLTEDNYIDYMNIIRYYYHEVDYDGFLYD